MSDKWKSTLGGLTYIYPSANSDDGGSVNTELNIKGITSNLTSKNYVVRENLTDEPLKVTSKDNLLYVTEGTCVLDGYATTLSKPELSDYCLEKIDIDDFISKTELTSWLNNFYNLYEKVASGTLSTDSLPVAHLTIKLCKNTTGNIKGDLLYKESASSSYIVCEGCQYAVTFDNINSVLDTPYIHLCDIYPSITDESTVKFNIGRIINPKSKYAFIDISDLSDDIYQLRYEGTAIGECITTLTLDENGGVIVVVEKITGFDNGEPITTDYLKYNITNIAKRTHLSSSISTTDVRSDYDLYKASEIDSTDTDKGTIPSYVTSPMVATNTINGKSMLVARADHSHDNRYIINKDGYIGDSYNQTIGTKLTIGDNSTTTSTMLEVNGYITADKVYNAVWNDTAELYLKDKEDEDIEAGTVICKVKGKDTYAPATYDDRRAVVGVVSDSYGQLFGGDKDLTLEENMTKYIPVALNGRVMVKVIPYAEINEGDLLSVSAYKGMVTACPSPELGTIVGKALESSDGTKKKILMQVMLG